MSGNVVPLRGAPQPDEPVAKVVEFLEGLLNAARQGRVRAVAAAWTDDQSGAVSWAGADTSLHAHLLIAEVSVLQHSLVCKAAESGDWE